ncbi:hypothetical protein KKI24_14750 [bacterium]|nr:hypothetical protein [bacterium]
MTKKLSLLLWLILIGVAGVQADDSQNSNTLTKPQVCLESNIRCILKKQGGAMYWCLKSNHQRTLDARRTTSPIKKTRLENLGHCAQIVPIREEADQ